MNLALLVLLVQSLPAEVLPAASPDQTGLSRERLARIARTMNQHVEANHVSGAIGLIARRGKIGYFETYGFQDKESAKPMPKDAIFRIYSMTKAITGVAVMTLYEEGKFFLTDPLSKYLPEFASMRVAVDKTDPVTGTRTYYTVPAERPITIRDLLRHTSGLDYAGPKDEQGNLIFTQLKVQEPGINLAEMMKRLAKAPLVHQPGSTFHYSLSIDVLGRLVEVASGQPLDQFFEERIFRPLGMKDTAFYVPEEKWNRLVTLDTPNPDGTIRRSTAAAQDSYKRKPSLFLGGAGVASTAMDYARFCQMLLNGGDLDGKRLLSRKSVELMATDHLGELPRIGGGGAVQQGYGFGLTFAVNLDPGRAGSLGSKGEYNWGGAAGTRFWIDPKEQMVGVFMINILPHTNLPYGSEFKLLAYQSIAD
ncbi:MAG: beta-lactamase family protein [Acidobacteria bacterium]|nr:beta-lactamase family protein [Acidobacteriota bacterium]